MILTRFAHCGSMPQMKKAALSLAMVAPLVAVKQVNLVTEGKELFHVMGCAECHAIDAADSSIKSGPSLYHRFPHPAGQRPVLDATHRRIEVTTDEAYLFSSLRQPAAQLAEGYPAIMPAFPKELLSDDQVRALWHYLRHQADAGKNGPAVVMGKSTKEKTHDSLFDDPDEVLVGQRAIALRAPVLGASARAVHVGLPTGYHFSFDPRHFSVRRVWSGGFLHLKKERTGRSIPGSDLGRAAKVLLDAEPLLLPLNGRGEPVDLEFKQPDLGDNAAIARHLWKGGDFLKEWAAADVAFRGYDLHPDGPPTFRFRIGPNELAQSIDISSSGLITVTIEARLAQGQRWMLREDGLRDVAVEGGVFDKGIWTLPAGKQNRFVLRAQIIEPGIARAPLTKQENRAPQERRIEPSEVTLPPGYRAEQWSAPHDFWGRPLLFEPTAIDRAADGTLVVGTRSAGIWRLRNGTWQCFAEGTYECLGLHIEDDRGDKIVIAQKPELTRLTDLDGDGFADRYETVCDAFGFHGDYHEYTHGLVRDEQGNYLFTLNLCHSDDPRASYKAGGNFMGSMGGYRGWACRVTPQGQFQLIASGLRSPAGLGQWSDGTPLVVDNQGEYFGSSKIFVLKENAFYGHPASLVSLPNMKPSSSAIRYELWKDRAERCAVWLPHNRYANSPGHPVVDRSAGKFGPYAGQLFLGDQTQSTLMRVDLQKVDQIMQGSVMLFGRGFSSGLMRPCFLADGSLLLGQTGRGWSAKGGKPAALQRVLWDGKTIAADILHLRAEARGIRVSLTSPLKKEVTAEKLLEKCRLASWTYLDSSNYGSPEHETRENPIARVEIAADRRSLLLHCEDFSQPAACLDRLYHFRLLEAVDCFEQPCARHDMDAYLTLRAIPK